MAVVLLSNLAPLSDSDAAFFTDLTKALRHRGHQVVFWSPAAPPALEAVHLPCSWTIMDWLAQFPVELLPPLDGGDLNAEKWAERLTALPGQNVAPADAPALLEIVTRVSQYLLYTIRPDLFLAWNSAAPQCGVLADLCRQHQIPVMDLSPGVLPATWCLDNGPLGLSALAGRSLEALAPSGALRRQATRNGRRLLQGLPTLRPISEEAAEQFPESEELYQHLLSLNGRPRIAVLTSSEHDISALPDHTSDRQASWPGYRSSLAAAHAIALRVASQGGVTVVAAPPLAEQQPEVLDASLSFYRLGVSPARLIEWADVVVSTGSVWLPYAFQQGRPVILMARDLFAGKGIAYEALQDDAISEALGAALKRDAFESRTKALHTYLGWLAQYYLIHPESQTTAYEAWSTDALADKLHQRHLATRPNWAHAPELVAACREGRPARSLAEESGILPNGLTASADLALFSQALYARETTLNVVDVDHTLIHGLSTELYLNSIRPRWLAAAVHAILNAVHPWTWMTKKGQAPAAHRDHLRVLIMTLLFPWSPLLWKVTARSVARDLGCQPLLEMLRRVEAAPCHILTRGYRIIVAPLVRALGLPGALISAESLWKSPDIHLYGKAQILREAHGNDTLSQAIVLSHTPEERDLFAMVRQAWVIEWPERSVPAFASSYAPLRYTSEAKYPTSRNHPWSVGEDFTLAALVYALAPALATGSLGMLSLPGFPGGALILSLLSVALFCLSFLSVYEIGYYENDFVAAPLEPLPTLSGKHKRFAHLPMERNGWAWGLGSGVLGSALACWALWLAQGDGPLPKPTVLAVLFGWPVVLLAARGTFALFNRLPPSRRSLLYPVLQSLKYFAPAVAFGITGVGAALMLAHVVVRSLRYAVYRHGGQSRLLALRSLRWLVFAVLALVLTLAFPAERQQFWLQPQLWLALAWLTVTALRESGKLRWGRLGQPEPMDPSLPPESLQQALLRLQQTERHLMHAEAAHQAALGSIEELKGLVAQKDTEIQRLELDKALLERKFTLSKASEGANPGSKEV